MKAKHLAKWQRKHYRDEFSKLFEKIIGIKDDLVALNLNILLVCCLCLTLKWTHDITVTNSTFASIIMTNVKLFNKLEFLLLKTLDYSFNLNENETRSVEKMDRFFKLHLCKQKNKPNHTHQNPSLFENLTQRNESE